MRKPNVYPGTVTIRTVPSGRHCAHIVASAGHTVYVGPWREPSQKHRAVGDAASWLEDAGYVHPLTHDIRS